MKKLLFVGVVFVLISCSNSVKKQDNESLEENRINLSSLGFKSEKEIELLGEGNVICELIAYETEITEKSEKSKIFDRTDIQIKYPEFMYVLKEEHGFHRELLMYTKIINQLIKTKAVDLYLGEYGLYLSGIESRTEYEIMFLDNQYLSILFMTTSVESTVYYDYYALNVLLQRNEFNETLGEIDKISSSILLDLSDFITKDELLFQLKSENFKIYQDNQEIADIHQTNQIIQALIKNINCYFEESDRFYIKQDSLVLLSDEMAHKGKSFEVVISIEFE